MLNGTSDRLWKLLLVALGVMSAMAGAWAVNKDRADAKQWEIIQSCQAEFSDHRAGLGHPGLALRVDDLKQTVLEIQHDVKEIMRRLPQ